MLDLIPCLDSKSFLNCFQRFFGRPEFSSHIIADGGCNFVANETQEFINSFGVEKKVNFLSAPFPLRIYWKIGTKKY